MITLTYACDRTTCGNIEVRELQLGVAGQLEDAETGTPVASWPFVPDGWGIDTPALDDVLHCPEHRT